MGLLAKGKPVADKITENVKIEVEQFKKNLIFPKLKIVRVGEREDDLSYERAAVKRMASCGIECEILELSSDISQDDFAQELKNVNMDETVHGILLFRPLPEQINENEVKFIISPEKDIDCFNPINVAKVMEGDETGFPPCTPTAAIEILKHYNVPMKGKNAVVLGRSMVVGKPAAMLLLKENASVTICHSKTENLPEVASKADILIAAIGKSNMVTAEYVKEGAAVIDVGINVDSQGNMTGDVNTEDCSEKCGLITPVPAGVGSVTTAVLAKHVVKACRQINNKI
jgi:methylenetetrahydrofolate dehydrogenase (NADP+)/methenyltetrahydrofolate cyclohydrolase